jgi:hypothetical protein
MTIKKDLGGARLRCQQVPFVTDLDATEFCRYPFCLSFLLGVISAGNLRLKIPGRLLRDLGQRLTRCVQQ